MLPGEAMNRAISEVSGKRYENIKILFDVLYIVAAAVISFITTGKLQGVREGSIIAAVVVGNIIKLYNLIFNKLTKKSAKKKTDAIRTKIIFPFCPNKSALILLLLLASLLR